MTLRGKQVMSCMGKEAKKAEVCHGGDTLVSLQIMEDIILTCTPVYQYQRIILTKVIFSLLYLFTQFPAS